MNGIITSRRSFITGLVSFMAAPAIVRLGSLMPVKQMIIPVSEYISVQIATLDGHPIFADARFANPDDLKGFVPFKAKGPIFHLSQDELDGNPILKALVGSFFSDDPLTPDNSCRI